MWTVKGARLRELRVEKLLTMEALAAKSGISARTISRYEATSPPVRVEAVACIAKVLGVAASEIARPDAKRAAPARAASDEAPRPPKSGKAKLPPRTRLEELVQLERESEPPPSLRGPQGLAKPLTAARLQDLFTAYRVHEGERFYVDGRVETQRGLGGGEAALLGSRNGVAARFHLLRDVAGEALGVTVHSCDAAHTRALQALHGTKKTARAFCRVAIAEAKPDKASPWFSHFASDTPKPWSLAVEGVEEVSGASARGAKRAGRARSR